MGKALSPSKVTIPSAIDPTMTVIEFLVQRFSAISMRVWIERANKGDLHWQDGSQINQSTLCKAGEVICYYREVENEVEIPFKHHIVFENEHIIVADKPHFLPVTPGGQYVEQCLLHRLQSTFGNHDIAPMHRLDKDTAGLVLFCKESKVRNHYTELFANKQIEKSYRAVARIDNLAGCDTPKQWQVQTRIERSTPGFLFKNTSGEVNAHSLIELVGNSGHWGHFKLNPITGKTHQLRLHMLNIGTPIYNDDYYTVFCPKTAERADKEASETLNIEKGAEEYRQIPSQSTFDRPLQLLAYSLRFIDPISADKIELTSKQTLKYWIIS